MTCRRAWLCHVKAPPHSAFGRLIEQEIIKRIFILVDKIKFSKFCKTIKKSYIWQIIRSLTYWWVFTKLYLGRNKYSTARLTCNSRCVVVCLQSCILAETNTVLHRHRRHTVTLWFAYKVVFWQKQIQCAERLLCGSRCCGLLTKLYFGRNKYSFIGRMINLERVVVCLQSCILAETNTVYRYTQYVGGSCGLLTKLYFGRNKYSNAHICI